ncbi:MAG: VWA domain-containing protein [Spirochaetales bacterium]|nr:VWA domain-containing protein [Spirochaetales bacterium]
MKKNIFFIVIFIISAFFLTASISAEPVDMVVLLDTSESVLPIYNNLVNYIIKDVLMKHVRFGDTFHLISFDSTPSLIISSKLKDQDDIEYVLNELFLLHPLGKYTDIVMALKYLRQYVSEVSSDGKREIIILTDGIHDPPPESPYRIINDPATGINLLEQEMKKLTESNWKLSFVELPNSSESLTGDSTAVSQDKDGRASDGSNQNNKDNILSADIKDGVKNGNTGQDQEGNSIFTYVEKNSKIYKSDFNDNINNENGTIVTGSPRITYPDNLGKINYHFTLPLVIENFYSYPVLLNLDKVLLNSSKVNILDEPENIAISPNKSKKHAINLTLPYDFSTGETKIKLDLEFTDDNRAFPASAEIYLNLKSSIFDLIIKARSYIFKIFIILLIIITIGFFILFLRYYLGVSVSESYKVVKKDIETSIKEGTRRPVVMKVEGQNDNLIGNRNIHSFKNGTIKTIGGGSSSYLIFLYKIKGSIAELRLENDKYLFNPVDSFYFPETGENVINDALNRKIKIKTDKGHIIFIKFMEYISPLEKINSIMHLTDHRGIPEERKTWLKAD